MAKSVSQADVVWGYAAQLLNMGAGLMLLPVILRYLPPPSQRGKRPNPAGFPEGQNALYRVLTTFLRVSRPASAVPPVAMRSSISRMRSPF